MMIRLVMLCKPLNCRTRLNVKLVVLITVGILCVPRFIVLVLTILMVWRRCLLTLLSVMLSKKSRVRVKNARVRLLKVFVTM